MQIFFETALFGLAVLTPALITTHFQNGRLSFRLRSSSSQSDTSAFGNAARGYEFHESSALGALSNSENAAAV